MFNGSGKNPWYMATRRVYLIDLINFYYHIKDHAKGCSTLAVSLLADKKVCDKIGACQALSDSTRSQDVMSGLVS